MEDFMKTLKEYEEVILQFVLSSYITSCKFLEQTTPIIHSITRKLAINTILSQVISKYPQSDAALLLPIINEENYNLSSEEKDIIIDYTINNQLCSLAKSIYYSTNITPEQKDKIEPLAMTGNLIE